MDMHAFALSALPHQRGFLLFPKISEQRMLAFEWVSPLKWLGSSLLEGNTTLFIWLFRGQHEIVCRAGTAFPKATLRACVPYITETQTLEVKGATRSEQVSGHAPTN